MTMHIEKIRSRLAELGIAAEPKPMPLNETVFRVQPDQLHQAVQALLAAGWWHLTAITALTEETHLELLYHFWRHGGLTLRIHLPSDKPQIGSITPLIPGAAFYEREIQELFAVSFSGLTITENLFLPDDWSGDAPMRGRADKSRENRNQPYAKGE